MGATYKLGYDGSVGKRREPHIESLRGLACILLVFVHAVGDANEGLRLPAGNVLAQIVWAFQPLRMPLFAFISGLVFDASARDVADVSRKILGKAHRLLVPLFSVGTLFFVIRAELYGVPLTDIWMVYFTAYEQFWYLTATFIIMTTGVVAAFWLPMRPVAAVALCWAAGIGLYLLDLQIEPDWLSITKAFYLAPFLFLGQLFRITSFESRVAAEPCRSAVQVFLACVISGLVVARQLRFDLPGLPFGTQGLGMLLLSLALCTFLCVLRWNVDWLARIGPYSYAIFLFHLFFTGGTRQLMERTGLAEPYLMLAVSLVAGLIGPMLVQHALLAQPWLAWAFLGQRRSRDGVASTEETRTTLKAS